MRKLIGKTSITEALTYTKVRCNEITFTEGLIRRELVNATLRNKCALSHADGQEDIKHFLLDCETYDSVRIKYFGLLADVASKCDNDRVKKISMLQCENYYYEAYD